MELELHLLYIRGHILQGQFYTLSADCAAHRILHGTGTVCRNWTKYKLQTSRPNIRSGELDISNIMKIGPRPIFPTRTPPTATENMTQQSCSPIPVPTFVPAIWGCLSKIYDHAKGDNIVVPRQELYIGPTLILRKDTGGG